MHDIDREKIIAQRIQALGFELPDIVQAAANYELAAGTGDHLYLSGQLPRVGSAIAVTGSVGVDVSLEDGRHAARLCTLRAIAVLKQTLGSLSRVEKILKLTVFVQSGPDFTQQSEVADAASDMLYAVFAPAGGHARSAVGVYQLPKNAAVEVDMIVAMNAG